VYFWCIFGVFCFSDAPDGRTDGRAGHGQTDGQGTPICRKRALASMTRQAPITAPSRRLSGTQAPTGAYRPSSGAYFGQRLSRRLQAPIRRLSGATPTGPHLASISDRQTDGLTDGQKHGNQTNNEKKIIKIIPNFVVFLVYHWCFLSLGRAGRTDRRTGRTQKRDTFLKYFCPRWSMPPTIQLYSPWLMLSTTQLSCMVDVFTTL